MKIIEINKLALTKGGQGTSASSYCSSLATITQNNSITGGALEGGISGFLSAGCGGLGYGMEVNQAGQLLIFRREQ